MYIMELKVRIQIMQIEKTWKAFWVLHKLQVLPVILPVIPTPGRV